MTALHRFRRPEVGLTACICEGFAGRPMQGYCQTPRRLFFLTWDGQQLRTPVGHSGQNTGPQTGAEGPADLDEVYEARFFDEVGELRWLRNPETDGEGTAAWLSKEGAVPSGFTHLDSPTITATHEIRIIAQQRAVLPGIPPDTRASYVIREYFGPAPGQAGEDGNQMVVEQRILRIEPWKEGQTHG